MPAKRVKSISEFKHKPNFNSVSFGPRSKTLSGTDSASPSSSASTATPTAAGGKKPSMTQEEKDKYYAMVDAEIERLMDLGYL